MQLTIAVAELERIWLDWTDWTSEDGGGAGYFPEGGVFSVFGLTMPQMFALLHDEEDRLHDRASTLVLTKDPTDETGVVLLERSGARPAGSTAVWIERDGGWRHASMR